MYNNQNSHSFQCSQPSGVCNADIILAMLKDPDLAEDSHSHIVDTESGHQINKEKTTSDKRQSSIVVKVKPVSSIKSKILSMSNLYFPSVNECEHLSTSNILRESQIPLTFVSANFMSLYCLYFFLFHLLG